MMYKFSGAQIEGMYKQALMIRTGTTLRPWMATTDEEKGKYLTAALHRSVTPQEIEWFKKHSEAVPIEDEEEPPFSYLNAKRAQLMHKFSGARVRNRYRMYKAAEEESDVPGRYNPEEDDKLYRIPVDMITDKDLKSWIDNSLMRRGDKDAIHVCPIDSDHKRVKVDSSDVAGWKIKLYTSDHKYAISALPDKDYLGCVADTRKSRTGEDWTRGNDLPDGKFSESVWDHIMAQIVEYELQKIETPLPSAITAKQAQLLYKIAAFCTPVENLPNVGDKVLSVDMEDPKTVGDHIFTILFDSGRKAVGHYWDEETRTKNTGVATGSSDEKEVSAKEAQLLYKAASVAKLKKKHGITKMEDGVGFSPTEKKWWGWSHRAAYGFGVGDKTKKGDAGYIPSKGAWTAKTLEDAKQMAQDFAEGVS